MVKADPCAVGRAVYRHDVPDLAHLAGSRRRRAAAFGATAHDQLRAVPANHEKRGERARQVVGLRGNAFGIERPALLFDEALQAGERVVD